MRPLRRFRRMRWLHVLTALLLVLSTSMPGWAHMRCLMGGHEEWRIGQAWSCCPDDEGTNEAAYLPTCCETTELAAAHPDLLPRATVQLVLPLSEATTAPDLPPPAPSVFGSIDPPAPRPPLLAGRYRAVFVRSLLL